MGVWGKASHLFSELSFSKKPLTMWTVWKSDNLISSLVLIVLPFGAAVSFLNLILSDSSDLDNFKTQTVRSAVNVREGQGVVLLCGPPAHSGGKFAGCHFGAFSLPFFYLDLTHRNYSLHMATFDNGLLPYSKLNRFLHPFMCTHALDNPHLMLFIQNASEPILTFTCSDYFF